MKKLLLALVLLSGASFASAQDLQIFDHVIITDSVPGSGQVILTQPSSGPIIGVTIGTGLQVFDGALELSGSGGVQGPNLATDNDIAVFNGTTGAIIKDSGTLLNSFVQTTRTVNGHALSSNVTVSKSDVGLGSADNTADAAKAVLSATVLSPGRTINGVLFDGSQNITVSSPNSALTIGTHLTGGSYDGTGPITIATDCASANTVSTLVCRDSSGNFIAGTITAALTGNASTATKLATARNINGTAFDGTAAITVTSAEAQLSFTDITTANATTSQHGLMQKYPGGTTTFLRADGSFATPAAAANSNFDLVCFDVANHDGCLARRAAGIVKLANGGTAQRYEVYGNDTGTLATSYDCYILPPANNASRADIGCGDAADATAFANSMRFISGTAGFVFFNGATRVAIATEANAAINIRSDLQYGFSQTASGPELDAITAGLQWDASGSIKVTNGSSGAGSVRSAMISSTASEVIASATTIAPTHSVFHVSGTTQITTITKPTQCTATCVIDIIPDGLFTTATGGNIAVGSVAVVNKLLEMVYDGTSWVPNY